MKNNLAFLNWSCIELCSTFYRNLRTWEMDKWYESTYGIFGIKYTNGSTYVRTYRIKKAWLNAVFYFVQASTYVRMRPLHQKRKIEIIQRR